jgi:rod shape-determining protein MreD
VRVRLVLLFAIAALAALAIQTAIPYWLPTRVLVPNLVVILAVDLGLRHHGVVPALLAFAMGYAVDAFSGALLGLNAFLVTLVFLLTYEMSTRLLVTNAAVGAFAVFIGVLIAAWGGIAISSGIAGLAQSGAMTPSLLLTAAVSAVVAPAVFALLARIKQAIGLPATPARE